MPLHGVSQERDRQHIEVAILIHIRASDGSRKRQPGLHRSKCESGRAGAVVVEPEHTPGAKRRHNDVEISVGIQIRGDNVDRRVCVALHCAGAIRIFTENVFDEDERRSSGVLMPCDLVVIVAAREHIEVAIAVDVSYGDRRCAGSRRGNCPLREDRIDPAIVLKPADDAIVLRSGKEIEIAVGVQVARSDFQRRIRSAWQYHRRVERKQEPDSRGHGQTQDQQADGPGCPEAPRSLGMRRSMRADRAIRHIPLGHSTSPLLTRRGAQPGRVYPTSSMRLLRHRIDQVRIPGYRASGRRFRASMRVPVE